MFSTCRYCGDELVRAREPFEICSNCENSPLCDRCGHPRSDHKAVFVRGRVAGCGRIIGDFQTLTSWRCGCEGFRPITGSLADAGFAASADGGADPPSAEPLGGQLRLVGKIARTDYRQRSLWRRWPVSTPNSEEGSS